MYIPFFLSPQFYTMAIYLCTFHSLSLTLCCVDIAALLNPEVAAGSGGIKAILKGLLKCQVLLTSFVVTACMM